jgi:hypothetical protein
LKASRVQVAIQIDAIKGAAAAELVRRARHQSRTLAAQSGDSVLLTTNDMPVVQNDNNTVVEQFVAWCCVMISSCLSCAVHLVCAIQSPK